MGSEGLSEVVIVRSGDGQEFDTSSSEAFDSVNNIRAVQSNMLDTGTSVEINIFLDLRLSLAISGFVDGHLNLLIEIGHDDRSQRREFSVDHTVIDRPESVEV